MIKPIPHIDIAPANERIQKEFFKEMKVWFAKGAFSGGEYVTRFEKDFAKYLGAAHCIGVNSGTSAVHLALLAIGIKSGDEVIVPAYTFAGTVWGVLYCGAKPVFVDVDLESGNISVNAVQKALSPRTRAVIAVHLFGQAANITELKKITRKIKIPLVEDAAQAHGGMYQGKALGTVGDIGCFSFYPTKNLDACGEGGAVVTENEEWARRVSVLRNHNCVNRYEHLGVGFNYRMEGIQGLFLSHKLKDLNRCNANRKAIAKDYLNAVKGSRFEPLDRGANDSAWHAFVGRVPDRESFITKLNEQKIGFAIYYPKILPDLPAFKKFVGKKDKFPNAQALSRTSISLPLFPGLPKFSIGRVVQVLEECV